MVATFKSTLYNDQVLGRKPKPSPDVKGVVFCMSDVIAVTSALAGNDLLDFFTLPKGATLLTAELWSTDIDTGTPAILIDVGDADGATTIFSSSTVGQAGTSDRAMINAARNKQYTVDTLIQGKVHTVAATPAAGSIGLSVFYTMDGLSTS